MRSLNVLSVTVLTALLATGIHAADFRWDRTILDNSAVANGDSYLFYDADEDYYNTNDSSAQNSVIESANAGRTRSNTAGTTDADEASQITVNADGQNICSVLGWAEMQSLCEKNWPAPHFLNQMV
ncbi:MAG TPA: hypothetical protein VM165_13850 [Planctomycetaceae bacterium]|nr:hypothetical protein [Planctomycetaceae bacterium]